MQQNFRTNCKILAFYDYCRCVSSILKASILKEACLIVEALQTDTSGMSQGFDAYFLSGKLMLSLPLLWSFREFIEKLQLNFATDRT